MIVWWWRLFLHWSALPSFLDCALIEAMSSKEFHILIDETFEVLGEEWKKRGERGPLEPLLSVQFGTGTSDLQMLLINKNGEALAIDTVRTSETVRTLWAQARRMTQSSCALALSKQANTRTRSQAMSFLSNYWSTASAMRIHHSDPQHFSSAIWHFSKLIGEHLIKSKNYKFKISHDT